MGKYYSFEYDKKYLYSSDDTNDIDRWVDEWLENHFEELYEYSGGVLTKDNVERYMERFKSEYIVEYKTEERK